MSSKTAIVNIALARIGATKQVSNVDTERSNEAILARTFFEPALRFVLRDFPWPFATAYEQLALVGGSASEHVNYDWTFSYRYPSDCLFVRRIVTERGGRNDLDPPPFRIGRDTQGRLIFTDEEDAQIEYTAVITDPEQLDDIAASALAWKLGADFAPGLSRIKDMAKTCMQMYQIDLSKSESRALNEGQQDRPQEAEFTRARD